MRYFTYIEPKSVRDATPVYRTLSEDEIIDEYWDYFVDKLTIRGFNVDNFSREDCIDEWMIVHWAWESD